MARRRSPARFLAPIFLIAVIVAGVMIVQAARSDKDKDGATATTQNGTPVGSTTKTSSTTAKGSKKKAKTYTVKSGDNLSIVAEKTGVSVARLEALNPDLDAQSLQVGQKLKLTGNAESP